MYETHMFRKILEFFASKSGTIGRTNIIWNAENTENIIYPFIVAAVIEVSVSRSGNLEQSSITTIKYSSLGLMGYFKSIDISSHGADGIGDMRIGALCVLTSVT